MSRPKMSDDDLQDLDVPGRDLALALRKALRESEQTDYVTGAKLSAARARALSSPGSGNQRWMLAGGGVTATVLLALVLTTFNLSPGPVAESVETASAQQAEAFDVLTDDNDPDFYEDLDLYRWLATDPAATEPGKDA